MHSYIHALKVHFKRCNNYITPIFSSCLFPFLLQKSSHCENHNPSEHGSGRASIATLYCSRAVYIGVFFLLFFLKWTRSLLCRGQRTAANTFHFHFNSIQFFSLSFTYSFLVIYSIFRWPTK